MELENFSYEKAMKTAIKLAELGRYAVAPNPTVGAILLNATGFIVASGFHQIYGGDHAEIVCLKNAKENNVDISSCTLVVTLEPCHHEGKTPPCSQAILEAGIKHVVIGARDPNTAAQGGKEFLEEHGIKVDCGILEEECIWLIRDFLVWTLEKRPYVLLKMATTLDGKVATRTGKSHYITSEPSRTKVAQLRANIGKGNGIILVGSGTFFIDNPKLDARNVNCEKQPKAAIAITSKLPHSKHNSYIIQERPTESIFLTSAAQAASLNAASLREIGAKVYSIQTDSTGKMLSITHILSTLFTEEKCPYILCEGGTKLASRLFENKTVDEYHQFIAPLLFADNEAKPVLTGKETELLEEAYTLKLLDSYICERDLYLHCKPLF